MSSVAYNITRKMEWMGRRLRYIDEAGEIKEWAAALSALNCVLKEVDIKETTDNWRPWRRPNDSEKVDGKIKSTSSRWDSLASKMGMETKKTVRGKSHILANAHPPRVHVEGDDVEMLNPKAAVLEMLRWPQKDTWSDSEDRDGDVREQDEATTELQETNSQQRETTVIEKKRNREMWRDAMLERLRKLKLPLEHWGNVGSGNILSMVRGCAPEGVRKAVIEDLGDHGTGEYLYKELMKFYEEG